MKKVFLATAVGLLLTTSAAVAQKEKKTEKKVEKAAKEVGKDVSKTAKTVGNKTAEVASKGASKVTDQVYKGKQGPNGQTIYIDNKSKYYWVDDKGHHQYVTATQIKDKPNQ